MIKSILFSSDYEMVLLPFSSLAEIVYFDPNKIKPVNCFSILMGYYQWNNQNVPIINLGHSLSEQLRDPHFTKVALLYFPQGLYAGLYFSGLPKIIDVKSEDIQSRMILSRDENDILHYGVTVAGLDAIIPNVQACFNRLFPLLDRYHP